MTLNRTMILATIDETLASARAALAVSADPVQSASVRAKLGDRAGADIARLVAACRGVEWAGVPHVVLAEIEKAGRAASGGDLRAAEEALTVAREQVASS